MQLQETVSQYIIGVRHIGLVCDDLDATLQRLQRLFSIADAGIEKIPADDRACDTRFAFFDIGGQRFELIQPVSPEYRALLEATNRGVNHVCYTVRNLPAAVNAMAGLGVRPGHVTPNGIIETNTSRMVYFNPEDTAGLLIEFVEDL